MTRIVNNDQNSFEKVCIVFPHTKYIHRPAYTIDQLLQRDTDIYTALEIWPSFKPHRAHSMVQLSYHQSLI